MQWTERHVVLLSDKQIFETSLRAASECNPGATLWAARANPIWD